MARPKQITNDSNAEEKGIVFFGEIDRNEKGQIKSEFPAYYFESNIEDLRDEIGWKKRALERKNINWEDVESTKKEVEGLEKKLHLIETSKPKLKGADKDKIYNEYKRLGGEIRDAMFPRTEMMKGLASGHEEAKRMVNPSITVDPRLAAACNVKLTKGKASRNDASKMFKIMGKVLGDVPTNTEFLRRDRNTGKVDVVFPDEEV